MRLVEFAQHIPGGIPDWVGAGFKPAPTVDWQPRSGGAAIWRNEGATGVWFNVTVSRLYNNGDGPGDWKSSDSFGRDDLLVVGKVLDMAHTRIFELQAAERDESAAA